MPSAALFRISGVVSFLLVGKRRGVFGGQVGCGSSLCVSCANDAAEVLSVKDILSSVFRSLAETDKHKED